MIETKKKDPYYPQHLKPQNGMRKYCFIFFNCMRCFELFEAFAKSVTTDQSLYRQGVNEDGGTLLSIPSKNIIKIQIKKYL